MNPKQPKKMLIMDVLAILRRYTDANHRLSQSDIVRLLERDFGMTASRKAVARNLADLIDDGFPIEFRTIPRTTRNPSTGEVQETSILTDYYLEHDFTEPELRLLVDGLVFSRHISPEQRKQLISKLEGLASVHFKARMGHVHAMPQDRTDNKQLFYTIELLDEALSSGKKVSFKYLSIGVDKRARPRCRPDGTERVYVCTPYQMAVNEGKYYLICNYDKYDDISNYRVDRIVDLAILDERGKPFESLHDAAGNRFDLATYMREHIHMYAGGTVRVRFRVADRMVGDVVDVFGDGVRFLNEHDGAVDAEAFVNELAMERFGRSNAPDIVVLSPACLRDRIRADLQNALDAYGDEG